jgi:hypothetical protein
MRPTVERRNREERSFVDDELDQTLRVVHAARLAWHEFDQLVSAPVDRVGRVAARRELVDARRQVRQVLTDHAQRVGLVGRQIVDHTALAHVDLRTSEVFFRDVVAEGGLHDGGTTGEHLTVGHHHTPVRETGVQRGDPGRRAEHRGHDGRRAQQLDIDVREAVGVGQIRTAERLEAAHCRRRLEEADRAAATRAPVRRRSARRRDRRANRSPSRRAR